MAPKHRLVFTFESRQALEMFLADQIFYLSGASAYPFRQPNGDIEYVVMKGSEARDRHTKERGPEEPIIIRRTR